MVVCGSNSVQHAGLERKRDISSEAKLSFNTVCSRSLVLHLQPIEGDQANIDAVVIESLCLDDVDVPGLASVRTVSKASGLRPFGTAARVDEQSLEEHPHW
jgi:hypothetical protein